jgi:heat shock protein 5
MEYLSILDTFEVSVLCVDDGICEVLATTGDARLTFKKIVQHLVEHFIILHKRETTKDMHRDERAVQNLRREVEKATYELCIQTETQIKVFDSILVDEHYVSKFTRTEFEDLTQVRNFATSF